jgi:hypothetical protein
MTSTLSNITHQQLIEKDLIHQLKDFYTVQQSTNTYGLKQTHSTCKEKQKQK